MVELGMAVAWEKPVFLFRDDFRRCTDSEAYPLNLMLFTGLPEAGWEAYWYASIGEVADPDKALSQWLRNGATPGILGQPETVILASLPRPDRRRRGRSSRQGRTRAGGSSHGPPPRSHGLT